MNIDTAYPSKYIKESDLQGQARLLTIARVTMEAVDQSGHDMKPVVFFQGAQKGMVLNVTNKNVFVLLYGTETDNWAGRQIELYPSQTDFRGEVVACIRCRAPNAAGALGAAPAQAAAPLPAPAVTPAAPATNGGHNPTVTDPFQPPQEQTAAQDLDDEIPF